MGFFGALHFWYQKWFGKVFDEMTAKAAWFLVFVGFNVTFFPQFFMGFQGMPRRYATYPEEYVSYHALSTYGSWILGLGILIMTINLLLPVIRKGNYPESSNPYGSLSLEWQVPSPPPHENFDKIPTVTDWTYSYGKK